MCLNPILLYNPVAIRMWDSKDSVIKNNEVLHNFSKNISFNTYAALCGFYKNGKKLDNIHDIDNIVKSNYIIVNGCRINTFISAPCGRCAACLNQKRKEYRSRLLFEASDSACMCFFTLTYNSIWYPALGLVRDDVSRFLKRFRINLQRSYVRKFHCNYNEAVDSVSFRCFYCGEYGKRTKRAHYHGLLFFKHDIIKYYGLVKKAFTDSWNKGFVDFQFCKNPSASASYVSKYITKQTLEDTPAGMNPCFVQGPSRNGGLGCSNLEKYKNEIIKSKSFVIFINVCGKCIRCKVPSTLINKIFSQFGRCFSNVNDYFYIMDLCFNEIRSRKDTDPLFRDHKCCIARYDYSRVLELRGFLRLGSRSEHSTIYDWKDIKNQISNFSDTDLFYTFDCIRDIIMALPSRDQYISEFLSKQRWLQTIDFPTINLDEQNVKSLNEYENYLNEVKFMQTRHVD